MRDENDELPVKVWVTGASGMLAHAVRRVLESREIPGVWTGRELDITDAAATESFAATERPTHVINCAGYTRVDDAESDAAAAFAVNAVGAENVARAARRTGASLVHFSTDYVFDGESRSPYGEADACSPPNVYGRTKHEGERRVLALFGMPGPPDPAAAAATPIDTAASSAVPGGAGRAYIIRTSWLFGEGGANFVTAMLRLLRERESIEVVADQHSRPTYTWDLARAALLLAGIIQPHEPAGNIEPHGSTGDAEPHEPTGEHGPAGGQSESREPNEPRSVTGSSPRARAGIYHFANAGATTWYGFASEIQRQAVLLGLTPCPREIEPISTADSGRSAPRPAYSVLATDRIEAALGEAPRSWQCALADYLEGMVHGRTPS